MNIHFCDTFLKGQHTFPSCGRNECCYFDRNNTFLTCSSFWQQLKKQHGSCGISCCGGLCLVGEAPWTMVEIAVISFFIFKKKNNREEQKSFKERGRGFRSHCRMWPPGWWEQIRVLGSNRQGGRQGRILHPLAKAQLESCDALWDRKQHPRGLWSHLSAHKKAFGLTSYQH